MTDTRKYQWQIWSDLISMEGQPDYFVGTEEEAEKHFADLHRPFIEAGYHLENYTDEMHIYSPDVDWDDDDADLDPVAGMTCEGDPE